jgi:hypothetical protein
MMSINISSLKAIDTEQWKNIFSMGRMRMEQSYEE